MDQQKPFKTIEVVDSRTQQLCKVACMSCIRGHRTTSCGIPVCRTKIFWTVKRPGRPANSCTCRFGATGGCKCVVARSTCPHKPKKGEKRSGECRCDENGRYCCLIEPDHWAALMALEKPTITFYPTRDALELAQAKSGISDSYIPYPPTPSDSSVLSPRSIASAVNTPGPVYHAQFVHTAPIAFPDRTAGYTETTSPLSNSEQLHSGFGMIDAVAPQDAQNGLSPGILNWSGDVPMDISAFDPYNSTNHITVAEATPRLSKIVSSCCASTGAATPNVCSPVPDIDSTHSRPLPPVTSSGESNHINFDPMPLPTPQQTFDFDKLQLEYLSHQLPSAICQNCGLSGCTCRNCPPIFQNFGTTSWAQCCGRKHARDPQPVEEAQKVPRTVLYNSAEGLRSQRPPQDERSAYLALAGEGQHLGREYTSSVEIPSTMANASTDPLYSATFDLEHDFLLPHDQAELDLSEFLLAELGSAQSLHPNNAGMNGDDDEGGSGGCCCGD